MKEPTRPTTRPNSSTLTTSACASQVASKAVKKSSGGNEVNTGKSAGQNYTANTESTSGNLSGIPHLTINGPVGGIVTHEYNSQPRKNQNKINVNNSNVLKPPTEPQQRGQRLSTRQPVKRLNINLSD